MAIIEEVDVDKKRFMSTLKAKNISIRKLTADYDIQRSDKSIRTDLNRGKMPREALEQIARKINVEPDFLSGKMDREFDKIGGDFARIAKAQLHPDDYPFIKAQQQTIGYKQHFKNTLTMCGITWEQYQALSPIDRIYLRRKLALEEYRIIHEYFKTDAFGDDTYDKLSYYEMQFDDIDPEDLEAEGVVVDWPDWLRKSK